jgi:DNA-binding MarR family transcriptional regulator
VSTKLLAPAAPESAGLSVDDFRSLAEFRRAIREFLAFSEESARSRGVTAQQHQALLAIKAHDGGDSMSIGELAQSLMIRNHSAVGLVARLVERGLVRRRICAADRRRVLLDLQPSGEVVLAQITRNNLGKLQSSARSLRRLLALLKKIETAQLSKGA